MTTPSEPNYVLYYWNIGFRGNFIRSVLQYTDTPCEEPGKEEIVKLCWETPMEDSPFATHAPPMLIDRELDLHLSQTTAIVGHVARRVGLEPTEVKERALADKVLADALDVIAEITHSGGTKMWDAASWKEFVEGRFTKWLKVFEQTGTRQGLTATEGFMLGTRQATHADTSVFALWAPINKCFPELRPLLRKEMPCVMALMDRLSENKGLQALLDRFPDSLYCGGQIEKSIRASIAANKSSSD